jgi:hypothetical protein
MLHCTVSLGGCCSGALIYLDYILQTTADFLEHGLNVEQGLSLANHESAITNDSNDLTVRSAAVPSTTCIVSGIMPICPET